MISGLVLDLGLEYDLEFEFGFEFEFECDLGLEFEFEYDLEFENAIESQSLRHELAQQSERTLIDLVGLRQHRRSGLGHDLELGHLGRLVGKVRVTNLGLR